MTLMKKSTWNNFLNFFAKKKLSNTISHLRKSLYGLKHSPHTWFERFQTLIQQFGMIQNDVDHSRFYCHSPKDVPVLYNWNNILLKSFKQKILDTWSISLVIEVTQSKDGLVISKKMLSTF